MFSMGCRPSKSQVWKLEVSGLDKKSVSLGFTTDTLSVIVMIVKPSLGVLKMTDVVDLTKPQATRRGVSVYEKNPFMMDMSARARRVINKRSDMMLANATTGEIQSQVAGFWEVEEVDATKFVKLFVRGVKALKELTSAGTKVFEVLYLRVQQNKESDRIFMAWSEIDQTLTPMSKATYMRGMRELTEKGFIAATPTQGMYWLNPSFIWNGDRLAFVKEYRKANYKKPQAAIDTKTRDLFSDPVTSPATLSAPVSVPDPEV